MCDTANTNDTDSLIGMYELAYPGALMLCYGKKSIVCVVKLQGSKFKAYKGIIYWYLCM